MRVCLLCDPPPEQTLGRGLRRMTPPGQANEVVAVIEHEAFARLYRDELAQEGLPLEIVDADKVLREWIEGLAMMRQVYAGMPG